jgi:chemotaxis protein MotB
MNMDKKRALSELSVKTRSIWLLSYGDLITLLITFFIMMISLRAGQISRIHKWVEGRIDEAMSELQNVANELNLNEINISRNSKGIRIALNDPRLFETGSAEPRTNLIYQLDALSSGIKSLEIFHLEKSKYASLINNLNADGYAWNVEIRIEGHTDNIPLTNSQTYKDNWELSAARAQTVMRLLQESTKLPERQFAVAGFGEFQPIDVNNTGKGRENNRRVEVYISASIIEAQ